jgi:2-polyprenyl-3-methyl-5-hydroxy-6-metoxy-1,4-benzoquinol methylase
MTSTDPAYAARLERLSGRWWKRLVPNPYRWNIRRLAKGRVLDVGCGIGRCLEFVRPRGIGIDPNSSAVSVCRSRALEAYTPDEFDRRFINDRPVFDSLLCSHVLEHLDEDTGVDLIVRYLPWLRTDGRIVMITPQERGQRSDPTHVRFMDRESLTTLATRAGLRVEDVSSFPLPRWFGRWFIYNETVTILRPAT